jgi:hypothetical protein
MQWAEISEIIQKQVEFEYNFKSYDVHARVSISHECKANRHISFGDKKLLKKPVHNWKANRSTKYKPV